MRILPQFFFKKSQVISWKSEFLAFCENWGLELLLQPLAFACAPSEEKSTLSALNKHELLSLWSSSHVPSLPNSLPSCLAFPFLRWPLPFTLPWLC